MFHPHRFCESESRLTYTLVVLLACAMLASCREEEQLPREPAPPAPTRPPTSWVDTDAPEQPAAAPESATGHAVSAAEPMDAGAMNMTPWTDLRAGQWACYRMLDGYAQRLTVRRVDQDEVELVMEMFLDGQSVGLPATRIENRHHVSPLAQAQHRAAAMTFTEEQTIVAAGRTWNCGRVTARWREEGLDYVQETWLSERAPLSGLLRQETRAGTHAVARTELSDFGYRGAGPPECP